MGYVVDAAWLKRNGLGSSSVRDYVARGWLERVGSRLYRRSQRMEGSGVAWELAVLSLQQLLDAPVHVGGMTALELAGYWQYVPMGRRTIWLYSGSDYARSYLGRLDLDADVDLRRRNLFDDEDLGVETRNLDLVSSSISPIEATDARAGRYRNPLRVSGLERAILEVLEQVPHNISFEHGAELFDGLSTLRPRLVEALLHSCRSVKAKRLFLYFAREQSFAWTRKLKAADIDRGTGKRQIVVGGELDPEFLITVPRKRRGARRGAGMSR